LACQVVALGTTTGLEEKTEDPSEKKTSSREAWEGKLDPTTEEGAENKNRSS